MPDAHFLDKESRVNVTAEGLFTDREEPRKAFWNTYMTVKPTSYEVIAYYGTGGIGKTTLLKKLASEMDERIEGGANDHLTVSFEGKPDKEYVLYMISRQLMLANRKLACPLFDTAFTRLLAESGKSIESYENEMKKNLFENPLLKTAVDIADTVSPLPGIGAAADILERVCTFAGKRKGAKERKEGEYARLYYEIECSDKKDLRMHLHEYLRVDVEQFMAQRPRPFVFFLDGYENFVDIRTTGRESMNLEADLWLKDPVRGFAGIPNTLWVIAGREKPHWDTAVISEDHMHRIGDLSERDTVDFFHKAGIEDVELVGKLYALTNGTPAFMDMCVDTYRSVRKLHEPVIEDFGKDTATLACRYLENMSPEMRTMLFILVGLPNVWNRQWAESAAKELGKEYCIHILDDILNMSIVERVDEGFRLHKTLRDVIKKENDFAELNNVSDAEYSVIDSNIVKESQEQILKQLAAKIIHTPEDSYIMGDIRRFGEQFSCMGIKVISDDDMYALAGIIERETDSNGDYRTGKELIDTVIVTLNKLNYEARNYVKYCNVRNKYIVRLGDYQDALTKAQDTYTYALKSLGEEHPDTLRSLNILASGYSAVGDYKRALELKEKCYEARVRILGEEHPDTLASLNNLANGYAAVGDNKRALELKEKCYEAGGRILGEEHPVTLRSLNNLALGYAAMGDNKRALELYEKCYDARVRILGEEHPDTLRSLNNLANGYAAVGDNKRALELKEKCYEARVRILGEEHPNTLASLNSLASGYSAVGDYKRALELKEKCYEARVRILGEEHPDTLVSLNNLAFGYAAMGDNKRALELKEKCYDARVRILGEEHPDTLTSLNNLANGYSAVGDNNRALELDEKCYEARVRVLGEEHPDTLRSLNNLASDYSAVGDSKKALELYEKCYEARVRVLGKEHPDTIKTLKAIQSINA